MPKTAADLFAFLDQLGITTETHTHPPLFTVADSRALRGELPGVHIKNLFLKDKRDSYFLLCAEESATIDLKTIHQHIGAAGKVSFGREAALMELLGVAPGAVSPFGLLNDTDAKVKVLIDQTLVDGDIVNAHPLTNEATTAIPSADLLRFIRATGHQPQILKLNELSPNQAT